MMTREQLRQGLRETATLLTLQADDIRSLANRLDDMTPRESEWQLHESISQTCVALERLEASFLREWEF